MFFFFFFNDTATTEIYTLSLHDALPISPRSCGQPESGSIRGTRPGRSVRRDRKSTRLNSSHSQISYAVFCLKKKKKKKKTQTYKPPQHSPLRRNITTTAVTISPVLLIAY